MGYALLLISFSKPATERSLDASEILILLCGLILAMGAAGEYIEEHGTLPEWMKWSRRPKIVFVWMVALSLVGEFVGDAGVFVFSGHLQTINDGEYTDLNKEAGNARKEAGKANKEAANLEKETEVLRGQNIRLAEDIIAVGNRAILLVPAGDNRRRFVESTRALRGQNALVEFCNAFVYDPEVQRLTHEIADSLTDAGWRMPRDERGGPFIWYTNMGMCAGGAPGADQGIWVSVRSQKDKSKANLLLSAFKEARLRAILWPMTAEDFLLKGRPGGTVQMDMLVVVLANPAGRSNSTAAALQSVMGGARRR